MKSKNIPQDKQTNGNGVHSTEQPAPESTSHSPQTIITGVKALALITAVAFANQAAKMSMRPLFAAGPTVQEFGKLTIASLIVPALLPSVPEHLPLLALGAVLAAGPATTFHFAMKFYEAGNLERGPLYTHCALAVPTMFFASWLLQSWGRKVTPPTASSIMTRPALAFMSYSALENASTIVNLAVPFGGALTSCNILIGLGFLSTLLGGISLQHSLRTSVSPNRILALISVLLSLSLIGTTIFAGYQSESQTPCSTPAAPNPPLNNTVGNVRLLNKTESITGTIIVGENLKDVFRYIRVDHSLVGGIFINERAIGSPYGNSIYAQPVLQEAVRLAVRAEKAIPDAQERALVLGLGVGVLPRAFASHKIHTTVVELDPMIYNLSRTHFGVAQPEEMYIDDARAWVQQRASSIALDAEVDERYDYVIHDLQSGGKYPAHTFTMEFWRDLKVLVKDDGIVSVAFSGNMGSDASRAVLLTLQRSFGSCRAYHDRWADEPETSLFVNMAIFCTPSATPLQFRKDEEGDWLGSLLRKHVLESLPVREINLGRLADGDRPEEEAESIVTGTESKDAKKDAEAKRAKKEWPARDSDEPWILTDKNNSLDKWQTVSAVEYWARMRRVMPEGTWELY